MSDLINRQEALKAFEDYIGLTNKSEETRHKIIYILKSLPSEESERKKGKWVDGILYQDFDESEWEKVKCSVCENFVVKQIFYHDNKYHFCPHCGAEMR